MTDPPTDEPTRRYADFRRVRSDGTEVVVIYDTTNPQAWIESPNAIKLSNYPR